MINKLKCIIANETDPYKNLALEEYLFQGIREDECILYLWQNEKTVVIGRNQNPWKECRVTNLQADGGKMVRRLSGGGAVFHDLGNLNFTFLATKDNYNVEKQLEVILRAVNKLGIPAEKSGRNDITVEGKKFSGNAFYSDGHHWYHHGTILVGVDMSKLSQYLNVSRDKLISKGVESVRSRVTNLTQYRPELTIEGMKSALIHAFGEVYGLTPSPLELKTIKSSEITKFEEKFSSWEWNFGKKITFSNSIEKRFSWGDIELKFVVEAGIITECAAYSDALETELFEEIPKMLKGTPYKESEMIKALEKIPMDIEREMMMADILSLILDK